MVKVGDKVVVPFGKESPVGPTVAGRVYEALACDVEGDVWVACPPDHPKGVCLGSMQYQEIVLLSRKERAPKAGDLIVILENKAEFCFAAGAIGRVVDVLDCAVRADFALPCNPPGSYEPDDGVWLVDHGAYAIIRKKAHAEILAWDRTT